MTIWPGALLTIAIFAEVFATLCLKASDGFRFWSPAFGSITGYLISFYCLSLALRTIPVGSAYAIWSGVGIVLLTLVHVSETRRLDPYAALGALLILAGIVCINLFSESV